MMGMKSQRPTSNGSDMMDKMDFDKLVVICITVFALTFIGAIFVTTLNSRVHEKTLFDACINKGGSWVPVQGEGLCIQRGTF